MLELWYIYSTVIAQALAVVKYQMDQNCGGGKQMDIGIISFQFSPYNNKHYDCKYEMWSTGRGFLISFLRVDLFNPLCAEGRISLKRFKFIVSDVEAEVPGLPSPLCRNNLPWSSFPTHVYESDQNYLELRFQGQPGTFSNTSFEMMAVSYYTSFPSCQEDEYRCNNQRCIPKSVHNCDGIDWCGDGSGCDSKAYPDIALIVGLCCGLLAAIILVLLGVCIACYVKNKNNSLDRNPYNPYLPSTVIRDDGRLASRARQNEQHNQTRQISSDLPTYESVHSSSLTTYGRSSRPRIGLSEPANIAQQSVSHTTETEMQNKADQCDKYEPPPPEYDLVIHHKDIYNVTETARL